VYYIVFDNVKKEATMSQLIACKNQQGIVLATDSKAVDIDATGNLVEYSVKRLLTLTDHTVILSGGAAAGEGMAQALKGFIAEENINDVDAVYNAALPFLASEYTEFMRKACEAQPLDPVHHVHFILAGRSMRDPKNPFKMYFLWTKKKLPQLDGDEITAAFSVPRMIRLEYRLSQMVAENNDIGKIQDVIHEGMISQAKNNEEIDGPFTFAIISNAGIHITDG
jgi:hypothetical protein